VCKNKGQVAGKRDSKGKEREGEKEKKGGEGSRKGRIGWGGGGVVQVEME